MPNPYVESMRVESEKLRGALAYLDKRAADNGRALTPKERVSYDETLTRLDALTDHITNRQRADDIIRRSAAAIASLTETEPEQ